MVKKIGQKQTKALQVLMNLQKALLKRLADYVLENQATLRQAAEGAEGYGFTLHQLDELFLSRLNLIERAMAEIHKAPGPGGNRYRSMVFATSRDEVESEINSRLEKMPSARILGVTVSPASASSRVTYQFTEAAAAGEQEGPGSPPEARGESVARPAPRGGRVRSAIGEEAHVDDGAEDVLLDMPDGLSDDLADLGDLDGLHDGPGEAADDELLVTVLYYGPTAASDA